MNIFSLSYTGFIFMIVTQFVIEAIDDKLMSMSRSLFTKKKSFISVFIMRKIRTWSVKISGTKNHDIQTPSHRYNRSQCLKRVKMIR